jgi:putative methyltransferase (TIGR04325 family)
MAMAIPLVSDVLRFNWRFTSRLAACRGVYSTYPEAKRAGASFATAAYNTNIINPPEIIGADANLRRRDYPVLLWLGQSLREDSKVLNLGGNAGAEYFTYRQYLQFPPSLRWVVWELPGLVKFGEKLTQTLDAPGLSFATRLEDGDGADIVLTCGALQYFEDDLVNCLKRLRTKPRRLLINRVPLYEGNTFFTIQSVLGSVVPYRIQNREELVQSLTDFGYRLVDTWYQDHEIVIPFHSERTVRRFYGFYFVSDEVTDPDWRTNAAAVASEVARIAHSQPH